MTDCYTTPMQGDRLAALGQRMAPVGLDLIGVAPVRDCDACVSPPLRLGGRRPAQRHHQAQALRAMRRHAPAGSA